MKEKRECKIIQDLLPNYVERLTNEETNTYIAEHLSQCEDCKKISDSMKKEIVVSSPKRQEKEISFLKKYNRKIKILSGIILLIFITYVIIFIRNVAILSNLTNKAYGKWNPSNMHTTTYSHTGGKFSIIETYYKDERRLTEINTFSKSDTMKMITYFDGSSETMFIENKGHKLAYVREKGNLLNVVITPHLYFDSPYELMFMAAASLITTVNCNGEECYFINTWGMKEYYSKETGLTVRATNERSTTEEGTFDMVADYKYEFNTVKDEDLIPPDISEYEIIETN